MSPSFFFIHSVFNRSTLKMKICKIWWWLFLSLLVWHRSIMLLLMFSYVSLNLHPLRHNWPSKIPQFFVIFLRQFEFTEYHILTFLMVIIRFHTKTYWGSRELYAYKYIINTIYDKKKYKYCRSIVTCILPEN